MNILFHKTGFFCAILWIHMILALTGFSHAQTIIELEPLPPAFNVTGLDDRPQLRDSVRRIAGLARRRLREKTDLDWHGTVEIRWVNEQTFHKETGFRPEHVSAAASPSRGLMWINESSWLKSSEDDRLKTTTHEVAHLLVGNLPGGKQLPLWANEGIVMHLAGQWSWDEHLALLQAHLVGMLPPLEGLEKTFPREGPSQKLAYRMSYATVGVLASHLGDEPGEVRRLVKRLADPLRGPGIATSLFDEYRREDLQLSTAQSLGNRVTIGVIVLTGSGFFILVAAFLAIFAFMKLKAKRREQARKLEDEEAWATSLTDEDVQDIYGDREERWDDDDESKR